jgi:hypothetical protein
MEYKPKKKVLFNVQCQSQPKHIFEKVFELEENQERPGTMKKREVGKNKGLNQDLQDYRITMISRLFLGKGDRCLNL